MENLSIFKKITLGFWLGIGLFFPLLIVNYSGTFLTMFALPSMMEENMEESFLSDFDKSDQIKILNHREEMNGKHLLILGSIRNEGPDKAGSIRLEAELLDSDGNFVFECSEYINQKLAPGVTENFLIRCGCGDTVAPEHASIALRVVSASSY